MDSTLTLMILSSLFENMILYMYYRLDYKIVVVVLMICSSLGMVLWL